MKVVASIDFDGDCREAFTAYARILGGEVRAMLSHHDMPMPGMDDGLTDEQKNRIVHAWIDIGDQSLMGQDMRDFAGRKGYGVTVAANSVEDARRIFDQLSEGGTVNMPFGPQPWSPGFGVVTDRFGVNWMVDSPGEPAAG